MPGDPGDQILLILLGKLHKEAIAFHSLPQLLEPFVRLPGRGKVGEHHRAVVRDICQNLRGLAPIAFIQTKQIHIIHLNQSVLGHHGKVLHRVGKALDVKGFIVQTMVVKRLRQFLQQELFHLCQIVIHQEGFLPEKYIEPSRRPAFQLRFQFLQRACAGLLLRHVLTSPEIEWYRFDPF